MTTEETPDWFLDWTKSITREDIIQAAQFFLSGRLMHVSLLDHDFDTKKEEYTKLMNAYFPA